jgi:hypothetical protein
MVEYDEKNITNVRVFNFASSFNPHNQEEAPDLLFPEYAPPEVLLHKYETENSKVPT